MLSASIVWKHRIFIKNFLIITKELFLDSVSFSVYHVTGSLCFVHMQSFVAWL